MFRRLLLLFIIVPIIELALLIQLGRWVGLWPTLAVIATTGVLGAALAGREGLRAWHAFQLDVYQGRVPGRAILDGLSIFVGGALLLTPGLVTDALGFALLLRPSRRWLQDRVVNRFAGSLVRGSRIYVESSLGPGSSGGPDRGSTGRPAGREIDQHQQD